MDIIYVVEWWDKSKLTGTICDYCGNEIREFPCAILTDRTHTNPHALCQRCREESLIKPGDNEYFETINYQTGLEGANPGVNFGGRKI